MILRPVMVKDFEAWKLMVRELRDGYSSWDEALTRDQFEQDIDRTWQQFSCATTHPEYTECVVAEHGGRLVGFMHMTFPVMPMWGPPMLYVADIFVSAEFRRRGIARAMLELAIGRGRRRGVRHVWWVTAHDNPARHLYDQYAPSESCQMYWLDIRQSTENFALAERAMAKRIAEHDGKGL